MKNLKNPILSLLILFNCCFLSCTSDAEEDPNNNAPGIFSANTTDTTVEGATIEWTESLDFDDDPVTYTIFLEGEEITNGISSLTYSFTGLESETSYTGYVESRDGKGGTNKANFSFTTEPEVIISTVDVAIVETISGTSFNIDAVFIIEPITNAKSYTIEVLEMNPDSNPTRIGLTYTWTPEDYDDTKIRVTDGNFVFYGMDYGAGAAITNTAAIAQARAFYAGVTGKARVTITIGN